VIAAPTIVDNAGRTPAITVVMMCFNLEGYIEQAVRSVQAQAFDDVIEILVADDCSSDGTVDLVLKLQRADARVVLLRSNKRLGVAMNFARAIKHASGKYLALLDGDDFWTDTAKCQRQFDYLECHANIVGVYESVSIVDADGRYIRSHVVADVGHELSKRDFVSRFPLTTQTLMLRRMACQPFPEWGRATRSQDWVIAWQAATHGRFFCTGGISAAYRQLANSNWAGLSPRKKLKEYLDTTQLLNENGALDVDPDACERQYEHAYLALREYVDEKFSLREAVMMAWMLSFRRKQYNLWNFLTNAQWLVRTYYASLKRGATVA